MSDRIAEIENRLNAATPGPWFLDSDGDSGVYTEARASMTSGDVASAFRREDEAFIAHSPSDVAYLLAELRKRDEALERVEDLAKYLDTLAPGDQHYAGLFRAAVTGDGA